MARTAANAVPLRVLLLIVRAIAAIHRRPRAGRRPCPAGAAPTSFSIAAPCHLPGGSVGQSECALDRDVLGHPSDVTSPVPARLPGAARPAAATRPVARSRDSGPSMVLVCSGDLRRLLEVENGAVGLAGVGENDPHSRRPVACLDRWCSCRKARVLSRSVCSLVKLMPAR